VREISTKGSLLDIQLGQDVYVVDDVYIVEEIPSSMVTAAWLG
jgi:hypothetical protein